MLRSLLRLCERGFHQPLDHPPTLPGSPTSTQRKCANRGSSRRPVYLRRLPAKVVHDQSRIESLEQNAIRSDSRLPWDRRVQQALGQGAAKDPGEHRPAPEIELAAGGQSGATC